MVYVSFSSKPGKCLRWLPGRCPVLWPCIHHQNTFWFSNKRSKCMGMVLLLISVHWKHMYINSPSAMDTGSIFRAGYPAISYHDDIAWTCKISSVANCCVWPMQQRNPLQQGFSRGGLCRCECRILTILLLGACQSNSRKEHALSSHLPAGPRCAPKQRFWIVSITVSLPQKECH